MAIDPRNPSQHQSDTEAAEPPAGSADQVYQYDRVEEREHISDRQEEQRTRRDQQDGEEA